MYKEFIEYARSQRRGLVASLIAALSLLLAGCMQPLPLDTNKLRTATPGEPAVVHNSPSPQPEGFSTPEGVEPHETEVVSPEATEEIQPTEGIPTAEPVAELPTPTLPPGLVPTVDVTRPQLTAQDIWRQQQAERQPFDQIRHVRAPGKVLLWWFDPQTRQHVPLGWIGPEFQAQARFRLTGTWLHALEVPYHVNQSYGLVLSDSVLDRIRAAGYQTEGPDAWIDAYVFDAPDFLAP